MKYLIILMFSLFLFPKEFKSAPKKNFLPLYDLKSYNYSNLNSPGLHRAILTGDKTKLNKKYKKTLKDFGLLHILTPSGLHLSSLVYILSFSTILETLTIIVILLFLIFTFTGYDSMIRVIIFRLFYKLLKHSKPNNHLISISFTVTVLISVALGHYQQNPLSFLYSFIFWGTILYFKENKLLLIIILHLVQILIATITNSSISPLALFINPFVTMAFSFIYPIFLGVHLFPNNFFSTITVDSFSWGIELLNLCNILPLYKLSEVSIILALVCILIRRRFLGILLILMNVNSTQVSKLPKEKNIIWNIPKVDEALYRKKNKIHFIDRVCTIDERIFCKKKPSNMGGLNL